MTGKHAILILMKVIIQYKGDVKDDGKMEFGDGMEMV